MKYTSSPSPKPAGLGKQERSRYAELLRGTQVTISVREAAKILAVSPTQAAMQLALYARKGWLKRIYQGIYIPVPLESLTRDVVVEEPFVLAEKIFAPCYISGMNAAEYWGFTDQIFQTMMVMTQKQVRYHVQEIADVKINIHTVQASYFFGTKKIWLSGVPVNIADPTRLIVDMLLFPDFCGGIRFIADVLQGYYHSEYKNIDLLQSYLEKTNKGVIYKRLGFLVEKYFPKEQQLITHCKENLTQGYSKIDPYLECKRLIRRWRLWVPTDWQGGVNDKQTGSFRAR